MPPDRTRIEAARERSFAILERLAGGEVEAPSVALLNRPDFETRLLARYRATTEGRQVEPRAMQANLAALLHHDLQLALLGLESRDANLRRRGVRAASLSNLYVRLLPRDPRLGAAIYEGFLLPGASAAPATGWSSAPRLLEGAVVSFRRIGQGERQVEVLRQLLSAQSGAANSSGADVTRVHLTDALAGGTFPSSGQSEVDRQDRIARLREAIILLEAVSSPDLLGAKARLPQLRRQLAQLQARPPVTPAAPTAPVAPTTPVVPTAPTTPVVPPTPVAPAAPPPSPVPAIPPAPTVPVVPPGVGTGTPVKPAPANGAGGTPNNGTADNGAANIDVLPGLDANGGATDGGVGGDANGPRLAQNDAAGEEAEDETGAAPEGESEKMRRVRRATQAAQKAEELTKKAQEAATISLAKMLDAAEAQEALEAAEKPAAARRRNAGANRQAPRSVAALRQDASSAARAASLAAKLAGEAGQAAQQATAQAALLALLVHSVGVADTPDAPAAAAPAPQAAPPDVPVAQDATAGAQPAIPPDTEQPDTEAVAPAPVAAPR